MTKIMLALVLSFAGCLTASATSLTSVANVDNWFDIYISTNNNTLGTWFGSGDDWGTAFSSSVGLTSNTTNYIHLVGHNDEGPSGFLGKFTIDDTNFQFDNGTQTLLTNSTDWTQNITGYGNAMSAAVAEGDIGVDPWGTQSGYDTSVPTWIWSYDSSGDWGGGVQTVYFSARINSLENGSDVPEPASFLLISVGLLGLLTLRRRKY